jgi:hypothetical protein
LKEKFKLLKGSLKFKLLKNIDGRVKDVKERMNELDIK